MPRSLLFALFFFAAFLQAGAYGLTFMLPRLFAGFGGNEKTVGAMLMVTAVATLITGYFAGHLSDLFGRARTLGLACVAIAGAMVLYGWVSGVGLGLYLASSLLGFGWALTYSLAPVLVTRLVAPGARVQNFALLSVFVMAGFGLAPVLAAQLEGLGVSLPVVFYISGGCCALSAVLFFAIAGPVKHHAISQVPEAPSRLAPATVLQILRSPAGRPVMMGCLGACVFAGLSNFQTVFSQDRGLNYAHFYLTYTVVVVLCRLGLVRFKGGARPYLTIGVLQSVMCASVLLFMAIGGHAGLYVLVAVLFGLGYGVSYPILVAVTSDDAQDALGPQTLQLFALCYFAGIFGFPLVAGWMIVEVGASPLLWLVALLAAIEAGMALHRGLRTPVNA